jgi:SAM-dependent methyltransferase
MFSINRDFFIKVSSFWFLHRWHPEVAIRYLPIVDEIKRMGSAVSILDVGSGGLGIAPYLKRNVVGLDTHFSPPFDARLIQKKGSALDIPFPDKSFDVVISVDMFEHIPPDSRTKAIREMMRVAKQKVIIAVPCGEMSHKQDKMLEDYYREMYSRSYRFLDEQIEYGLPQKSEFAILIRKIAKSSRRKFKMKSLGNEGLALRFFLMKGWITKNPITDFLNRKVLLLAIPFLKFFDHSPYYRGIFITDFIYANRD